MSHLSSLLEEYARKLQRPYLVYPPSAQKRLYILEKDYRKIHVSLDEFDYLTKNYTPTYLQSADLSLEQANVITRTLESNEKDRPRRVALLAKKVQGLLSVTPRDNSQEKFLQTVLRDYQYYALEEI